MLFTPSIIAACDMSWTERLPHKAVKNRFLLQPVVDMLTFYVSKLFIAPKSRGESGRMCFVLSSLVLM